MARWLKILLPPLLALVLGGWGSPSISRDANAVVDWWLDYAKVRADPQRYTGKVLLMGGSIVGNWPGPEGSTLEVLCYPLDRHDRPEDGGGDCGHFLAQSRKILDPGLYRPGELVTLIGTVLGRAKAPPGSPEEEQPLFRIDEIYLWPPPAYWAPCCPYPPPFYAPWCEPYYGYPCPYP
jgi:outer membrane lipoprotein